MALIAVSARYGTGTYGLARYGAEDISVTLAGVSAIGAVESVAINGFEIDITERISTGVAGTGQVGTVNAFIKVTLVGVSATGQVGTTRENPGAGATGVVGTTNTPSLEPKVSEDIVTGVEGTGQVGSITANPGAGLAGVSATGGVGTLEHSNTKTPNGVSATGAVGVVSPNIVEKISGVAGTGQIGTPTQTAVVFDFEAVRDQFSSKRMIYVPRAA